MPMQLEPGMDAMHHSRLLSFRTPQGAAKCGEAVTLSIWAAPRFTKATLRLWALDGEHLVPMARSEGPMFTAEARMPETPGLVWYFFILSAPGETVYYGGESGPGALYPGEPPGYQITVYHPAFETPRWYREGIIYQIFPDRFRRLSAPTAGLAHHRALGRKVRYHEDWNEDPCFLPEPGEAHYQPNDFFGGSLAGIEEQLPYLKSLGISCLYLNPIFESDSNHRYDTADYRQVDPIVGDNEALTSLCKAAKALHIRVMLDGVFSHTGDDSVYFDRYGRYGGNGAFASADSPYRAWYSFGDYPPTGYRCWWGFPKLPEVNETDPGYQDFVYGAADSLLAHWAQNGITSWRLDVADELPDTFIAGLRARLKALDPDGVVLGEVWEDASTKEAYGVRREYVLGSVLDSVMNYPFRDAVCDFLLEHIPAGELNHRLARLRERYPKPFYYAAMNLLSTHDSVRAITLLGGAPGRDALTREQQAAFALSPAAEDLGKRRFILATALQMAIPGVPSIYYGDEVGLTGMADPFNRKTYPWGNEDTTLLAAMRALTKARRENTALIKGYCRMGPLHEDVYAVVRFTDETDAFSNPVSRPSAALALVNRSSAVRAVTLNPDSLVEGPDGQRPVSLSGRWRDVLTGTEFMGEANMLSLSLPALSAYLLVRDDD